MVLCRKRFGETAFGRLFQVKLELGREPGTEAPSITHVVLTHAEQRNVLLICQVSDGETCLNVEVIRNLRRPIDAYGVQGVAIQMGCCISWERNGIAALSPMEPVPRLKLGSCNFVAQPQVGALRRNTAQPFAGFLIFGMQITV